MDNSRIDKLQVPPPGQSQQRLMNVIDSLPINPALDLYAIEDKQLQAICFISGRAVEEAVAQGKYTVAANTIGAWLITAGQTLGVLGKDRNLSSMFANDIVEHIPVLINLARMISDYLKPWVESSKEAQGFCRNIVCKPQTHGLVALSFLPLVPPSLAVPWLKQAYDTQFGSCTDSAKVALLEACVYDLEEPYRLQPALIAARRVSYNALCKKFSRYHPRAQINDLGAEQQQNIHAKEKRLLLLVDRFRDSSHRQTSLLLQMIDVLIAHPDLQDRLEIAIFETGEYRASYNQRGFYPATEHSEPVSVGKKQALRKQIATLREWDHNKNYDKNMRELLSASHNFNPSMVIALDLPHSVVKGALKNHYPMIDWLNESQYHLAMGAHVIATVNAKLAEHILKQTEFGRLEDVKVLPISTKAEETAEVFIKALEAMI